jgi:DNA-binding transcriptional LysR family regulator
MELRHLHYFVAVAETMNLRQAAERLNMTQPPLSQQIQQLEMELGFELFHRHGRSISLTVAGEAFLVEANRILGMIDDAVVRARQTARGEFGQLHIGFVGSLAYSLLPAILRAYRATFPRVEVTLTGMTSNQQITALQEQRIDIGFCRLSGNDVAGKLRLQVISKEAFCVVLPHGHPLAQQEAVNLSNLAGEPFILFPRSLGNTLFDHIMRVCHQAGFTPAIEQEAIQMTTIIGLVAAGFGVSVLPASVMKLPHAGVRYVLLPRVEPAPVSIVWNDEAVAPTLMKFINIVRNHDVSLLIT